MKTLLMFLFSSLIGLSVAAQTGTVTIKVKGNRNRQVAVDNQYYEVNNSSSSGEKTLTLTTLTPGTHALEIVRRTNNYSAATNSINTSFVLRQGYDLLITVNANGSVSQTETRISSSTRGVSTTVFNRIYSQTTSRSSSTSRATYLESEFNNTTRMFTSRQVSQLIKLVNSENMRFKLAKQAYTKVSDKENYSLVSSLLISTANQNALREYIATVSTDNNNSDNNTGNASTPMSDSRFQVIFNELIAESGNANKHYYLSNLFSKEFNFFSSAQARRLIQQVTTEAERLYLAKLAYRGITDRNSYYNEVASLLGSSSSRTELSAYINSYSGTTTAGTAMSFSTFNNLYQGIYYDNNASSRYNAIHTAFTTSGNYFSVTQARQLIQLMTDDNSRLQLAKLGYKTLVDRANASQLSDLFTGSVARNEWNNFVNGSGSTGTGAGVGMNEDSYNTLYNNINSNWNTASRYNSISTAFTTSGNYFSVAQARQLIQLVTDDNSRLQLAKLSYRTLVDRNNASLMNDLFSGSVARNDWNNFVYSSGSTGTGVGMSDGSYTTLYNNVNGTWNASTRYSLVSNAFTNTSNFFSTTQVSQLLQLISSESDRLTLAKNSYDNVVDPANFTMIYDLFTNTYRSELVRFVSAAGGIGAVRTAMPDDQFKSMYRNVQFTFGLGAKMSELTKIFDNDTYYFTVAQAKQLIQLVSSESNRLALAKSSYNNITDPENFTQMNDVFSSQSSKDELNVYVTNNPYR